MGKKWHTNKTSSGGMMQDRFRFRVPFFNNDDKFIGYDYCDMINGINAYNAGTCHKGDIQLSTGLKDRKEKLIYEGDILCHPQLPHKVVVEWFQCGFWLNGYQNGAKRNLHDACKFYEVIGNIYENKELLEEQK